MVNLFEVWMNDPAISGFDWRRWQYMLFDIYDIPYPKTSHACEMDHPYFPVFKADSFPAIVRSDMHTSPLGIAYNSREYYELIEKIGGIEFLLDQETIRRDYVADVKLITIKDDGFPPVVSSAIVRYAQEEKEYRANVKHGGAEIPITGLGSLIEVGNLQEQILLSLSINPDNRRIPRNLLELLKRKPSPKNLRRIADWYGIKGEVYLPDLTIAEAVYEVKSLKGFGNLIGWDFVYGTSQDTGEVPSWFVLEFNYKPGFNQSCGSLYDGPINFLTGNNQIVHLPKRCGTINPFVKNTYIASGRDLDMMLHGQTNTNGYRICKNCLPEIKSYVCV